MKLEYDQFYRIITTQLRERGREDLIDDRRIQDMYELSNKVNGPCETARTFAEILEIATPSSSEQTSC